MRMSTTTSTSTSSTQVTESVLSGEDKSLNRLSRTPSMVRWKRCFCPIYIFVGFLVLVIEYCSKASACKLLIISYVSPLPPPTSHANYSAQIPISPPLLFLTGVSLVIQLLRVLYQNTIQYNLLQLYFQYKLGKHRSNALELVNKVPPIEVSGDMAVCDGGGGALGHPVEYIKVGNRGGEAVSCIYCGLKYRQKDDGHHH
jgi:uncharacterized Zn-finger protein